MDETAADAQRRLSGNGPLWRLLRQDLQDRLDRNEFDASFPGELMLASEYGVSRHTVRQALADLRRDGVVTAARGRPSKVADRPIAQHLGALYSLFHSAETAGMVQRSEVRRLEVCQDVPAAEQLGLPPTTPLVCLERLRLADGQPLALDTAWLPAARTMPLLDADFTRTSLYEQLRHTCGIRLTGGREWIRAAVPSDAVRRELCCEQQVAVLAVDRLGCSDGVPVEWRHTVVRGDRFSLVAEFTPHSYRFGGATADRASSPVLP